MINTKRTKLTLMLSTDIVPPPWKLLLEAYSHKFFTQNSREGFWQPRGIPRDGNRHEKWEVGRPIDRESSPPTL
jgi:hypothetical protein